MLRISSMSEYLDEEIFSGQLLFSGVALFNWLTNSSNLVLVIMSCYDHFQVLSTP